ncbi:hypothetical protein A0E43_19255 [Pectobacterium cacticida]|uniref:LPD7 domain-containing protein n=1 Tax=Pseudomonadota TaxID=1224 RepID=UPI0015E807B4|nr:LPD7 domain-containing protein [Polaromonas sp. E5S]
MDKGRELFIDQGRNLSIVKYDEQTSKQIAAALAVAQHKFGITLTVAGPDEFKTRAVAAAVEFELIVKFSDPAMETHRLQMTEAKRQAERESKRLALEAAREAQSQAAKVSLLESKEACVLWINGESGQHVLVDTEQSDYVGPVVQLDGLHAVQKVGRTAYAIHELENLDRVPFVGDTKNEIQYRGGFGHVKGCEVNRGGRER